MLKREQPMADPFGNRWVDTVALGFSILFVFYLGYAVWVAIDHPPGVDFVSFWAAGKLALQGSPELAYDIAAHRQMELTAGAVRELLPFPYPPPYLMLIAPLALVPFAAAFAIWVLCTVALYARTAQSQVSVRYAFAHPAAHVNVLIGQTGFLFAAIFIAGTGALRRNPFLGGAILGLIVLKPQLALLLPVALLAGREWRAIAGGLLSGLLLSVAAVMLFGVGTYAAFLRMLPNYTAFLERGQLPWNELASVFAFLRFAGVPQSLALALQGLVAAIAIWICWRAWAGRDEARVPILAAATLLAPPYLFTYDSLLLIIPMAWLLRNGRRPGLVALIWLFCLLPVAGLAGLYPGPNTVPLASLLSLWAVARTQQRPATTAGVEPHSPAPQLRSGWRAS